jgi:hypothetical protein
MPYKAAILYITRQSRKDGNVISFLPILLLLTPFSYLSFVH